MNLRARLVDPYYYSGIPLWTLARQNGVKSASYFWVGSEIPEEGYHPDYYLPYEESAPFDDRVDQVIEWLKLPEHDRPHFITLYFSSPDHEAHRYGPVSDEVREAAKDVDNVLGRLMHELDDLDFRVNVILVSDHGLKELEVRNETYVFLDEIMDVSNPSVITVNAGSQVHLYLRDEAQRDSLATALVKGAEYFAIVKPEEFPESWYYRNSRSGDLLLVARPGYYFRDRNRGAYMKARKTGAKFGVHGYDPDAEPDMAGIFYACGPNIKERIELPAFRNVHIYPLIARILGIPVPSIDGRFEVLQSLYREGR